MNPRALLTYLNRRYQARFRTAPAGPFNFYLLGDDPYVILTFTPGGLAHVEAMAERLGPQPCHFLVGFWWDIGRPDRVDQFRIAWDRLKRKYPQHAIHVLCNDPADVALFERRTTLPCSLVNHNCFLDEHAYRVMEEVPKEFDALYTARLGTYKRLELAEAVRSLVLITSPFGGPFDPQDPYFRAMRRRLAHAEWLNHDDEGAYRRIPLSAMCAQINRARTGLVLSSTEGACYASCEYLLCGLPVVSTPSSGGRAALFTEATARIVEADPEAVARGVEAWLATPYDPHAIRAATLDLIWEHRRRLFEVVDGIRRAHGNEAPFAAEWEAVFTNKMNYKCTPDEFAPLMTVEAFQETVQAHVQRLKTPA